MKTEAGWKRSGEQAGQQVATCFAVLFLLRNTQKTIGELKSADAIGGYGLANVAEIGVKDGKLIDKSQVTSVEDALKLLEDNKTGGEDRMLADRMVLDDDPKKKKEQLNRFARMLRNPDTRARRIAAKLLGRGDDLDFAPDLIFALSEGEKDSQVLRIAETRFGFSVDNSTATNFPRRGRLRLKIELQPSSIGKLGFSAFVPITSLSTSRSLPHEKRSQSSFGRT